MDEQFVLEESDLVGITSHSKPSDLMPIIIHKNIHHGVDLKVFFLFGPTYLCDHCTVVMLVRGGGGAAGKRAKLLDDELFDDGVAKLC